MSFGKTDNDYDIKEQNIKESRSKQQNFVNSP